jgi:hypothetical protein
MELAYGPVSRAPLPPVASAGMVVILLVVVIAFVATVRWRTGPRIKGPALTGTARVLGTAKMPQLGLMPYYVCSTSLRVEIPRREPYDVIITGHIPKRLFRDLERGGGTVAVQVDSTNPNRVRIDFTQPMPQAGSSSSAFPPARESTSYGEQPPFNGPQSSPGPPLTGRKKVDQWLVSESPYDHLTPEYRKGTRKYQRVMWRIIGVSTTAALVISVTILIIVFI